jgi:hypothetical protein
MMSALAHKGGLFGAALFALALACTDEAPAPQPPEASFRDAGARDGAVDASSTDASSTLDAALADASSAADASTPDAGEEARPDAGPADAGDPCTESSTIALSAAEAVARSAALDGRLVIVEAAAQVTERACTRIGCPPEDPCCNRCQATLTLDGVLPLVGSACAATEPGCIGDECTLVCRPSVLGLPRRYLGVLTTSGPQGSPGLALHRELP